MPKNAQQNIPAVRSLSIFICFSFSFSSKAMDHLKRRHVHAAEHYDLDARYHQVPLNDNEYPYYDYKDNKIHKPSRAYTKVCTDP